MALNALRHYDPPFILCHSRNTEFWHGSLYTIYVHRIDLFEGLGQTSLTVNVNVGIHNLSNIIIFIEEL